MSTLREIAAAAGVHISTASAALNPSKGNTRVGDEARARVLAAAKRLGYVPNESARRLRTGTSRAVAFLGGDFRNPFFAQLAAELEKALAREGLHLFVAHVAKMQRQALDEAIASLSRQGVHSVICWEESLDPPRRETNLSARIVSVGFTVKRRPGVWIDFEWAIDLAVGGMKQRGYRKLGFFGPGLREESPSVRARSEAFVEACKRLRLPRPVVAFHEGESWDSRAASAGAPRVLADHPQVEAWIGFNDVASLALLAHSPKAAVPRIVCFDGTVQVRSWPGHPPCLDLRLDEMADRLVRAITRKADALPSGSSEWIKARWVK